MSDFLAALNTGVMGLVSLLEVLLVIGALAVTTSASVSQAVKLYQWQSLALAGLTSLSVIIAASSDFAQYLSDTQKGLEVLFLFFLAPLLPCMLVFTIRPLLHRATLATEARSTSDDLKTLSVAVVGPWLEHIARWRLDRSAVTTDQPNASSKLLGRIEKRRVLYRNLERDAETIWQSRQTMERGHGTLLLFPVLLLIAVLVPFLIPVTAYFNVQKQLGLAVSLVLVLVGLYNMISKQDIISQVIGLLIMDQGLYLAVVRIVAIPVPATYFVMSLYFYTLITVFILVILLPKIRETAQSIDLTEIARESDLKSS